MGIRLMAVMVELEAVIDGRLEL
jgi:hypothetical protein